MKYPINEIFQTLQGEGCFTGTPSVFIRLQSCPVGCGWCDTKYAWYKKANREVDIKKISTKIEKSDTWANASAEQIVAVIYQKGYTAHHVVITGGEPCIYDLMPLITFLEQRGYDCQIETSGTHEIRCSAKTWVTVSPKVNMHGGMKVLHQALQRSDEVKHPVARQCDIDVLITLLETIYDKKPRIISLQPVNNRKEAMRICMESCITRNWRLSIQIHKYLNID